MNSENAPAHVFSTPKAVEGEENHHEKKPMLMKMKEKAKKVKDNINKKMHAHNDDGLHSYGHVDEEDDSFEVNDKSEMEVDPQVNGAPVYDSSAQFGTGQEGSQDPGKATFGDTNGRFEDDLPVSQKFAGGDRSSSRTGVNEIEPSSVIAASFKGMTVSDQPEGPRGKDLPADRSPTAGAHDQFSPRGKTQFREPEVRTATEPVGPRGSKDLPVDHSPTTGTHDQFSPREPELTATEPVVATSGTHDQFSLPEKTPFGEQEMKTAIEPAVEKVPRGKDLPADRSPTAGAHDRFSPPEKTRFGEPEVRSATEPVAEKVPSYTEKLTSVKDTSISAASLPEKTPFGEQEMKTATEPVVEKVPRGKDLPADRSPTAGAHDRFSPPEKTRFGEPEVISATEPVSEKVPSYTAKLTSKMIAVKGTAVSAASTAYDKVTAAVVAKPQNVDKGSSVKEYLAERLRPGEDEKALSEVLSEAVHGRKVDGEREEGPKVTGSEEVIGGKGMVEKIKGVVTSLIGGNGGTGAPQVSNVEGGKGAQQEFSRREDEQDIE